MCDYKSFFKGTLKKHIEGVHEGKEYMKLGIPLRGLLRRFARYVHRVTSEVAVSFLLEVEAQI